MGSDDTPPPSPGFPISDADEDMMYEDDVAELIEETGDTRQVSISRQHMQYIFA